MKKMTKVLLIGTSTALFFGCDGISKIADFGKYITGPIGLVPAGSVCTYGGKYINYGIDANGDGVLQDFETDFSKTVYACMGQPGKDGQNATISTRPATAEQCPNGGIVIIATDFRGTVFKVICNGEDGTNSVTVTEEATPEECPNGGKAVISGIDSDGDGYPDTDVTRSAYCNGSDAVQYTQEATPEECPYGGFVVIAGIDTDADNIPDKDITKSAYCNGSSTATTTEPATPEECPYGGWVVISGTDSDGDGYPDTDVTRGAYCNGKDASIVN
jgi:hypothetical protein